MTVRKIKIISFITAIAASLIWSYINPYEPLSGLWFLSAAAVGVIVSIIFIIIENYFYRKV